MKKIFLITILLSFYFGLFAQINNPACYVLLNPPIKTPNGTDLPATPCGDWESLVADRDKKDKKNPQFTILGDATAKYNCHAYAWYFRDKHILPIGDPERFNPNYPDGVWINNAPYFFYTNDDSYYQYNYNSSINHEAELRVVYDYDWHSAVTTAHPDTFVSKLSYGCLAKHKWNECEYPASNLIYFKRSPVIVSMNGANNGDFKLDNGAQATWTVSGSFKIVDAPGAGQGPVTANSVTVVPTAFNGTVGTLTAKLVPQYILPSNKQITITRKFTAATTNLSNPSKVCTGQDSYIHLYSDFSDDYIYTPATWSIDPALFSITSSNTNATSVSVKAKAPHGQTATLTATLNNGLGVRTRNITACSTSIIGPATVCTAPPPSSTHSLSDGYTADWEVSPGFVFHPSGLTTQNNSKNVTIKATASNVQSGTITAIINGVVVADTSIRQCYPILGPDVVSTASSGINYVLFNGVSGTVSANYWTLQNLEFNGSYTDNSVVYVKTPTANDGKLCLLQAFLNGDAVARKAIYTNGYINGPNQVCTTSSTFSFEQDYAVKWEFSPSISGFQVDDPYFDPNIEYKWIYLKATSTHGGSVTIKAKKCGVEVASKTISACSKGSSQPSGGSGLLVYPNPASGIVRIEIEEETSSVVGIARAYDVRLYNLQGNMLMQEKTTSSMVEFDVSGLPNGVYMVYVYDGENPYPLMQPLVVEH